MGILKFTKWPAYTTLQWLTPILIFISLLTASHLSYAGLRIIDPVTKSDQFTIGYFYDADNSKTIEEISRISFAKKISNQFALGYYSGAAWFKLTFHNESKENRFIVSFTEPFWTTFDLYEFKDNQWRVSRNGLEIPLSERAIHNSMPSFSIDIKTGESKTVYVKGTTVSSFIGAFQLFTEKEYYRHGRIDIAKAYNIYSGILFFIMLLTGFLYVVMRERIYLFYIGYVVSFIVWINVQNGQYLYLGFPGWIHALHAIGALVVFFLVLFTNEILDLKHKSPRVAKLFNFSALIIFLSGILISIDVPHINLFFNIFSSLFFLLLLVTSIRAWINKYFVRARYYLIALAIYMPTMALMTLTYNGFLPNIDITRYSFALGSFIEIIFFSFILVSHYYDSQQEKIRIQKELLDEREERANHFEREVQKRTVDLFHINEQLRHQTEELELTKQRLTIEATIDSLSTLYNRRYFLQLAKKLFDESKSSQKDMSILMIDIDRFKGINDNFGHDAGDEAIKACSNIFKNSADESVLIARYGGEEFIMLITDSTKDKALDLAEDIRHNVEEFQISLAKDKFIHLTLSIGITESNFEHDGTIEDIIKRADKALYVAKNSGRNKVVHN